MKTPYAFTLELPQPLPAAIESLRAALAAEQMAIVSEVDVQALLQARLGGATRPQKLLGVCSARLAQALTSAEPDSAALLPCGCSVCETAPGRTRIALQDPRVIAALGDHTAVRAACELAHAALRRAMDRLAAAAEPDRTAADA
jgi:uncharacterized protein (DUF302 family)